MTQKPKPMPVMAENIPEELKTGRQFIVWKWEETDGRWTKPLYHPRGHHAKSNDPRTWVSFDEALAACKSGKFDGIGRCFTKVDKFTAFDLDKCRLSDGSAAPWAKKIIDELASYSEITPSSNGFRVWVKAEKPGQRSGKGNIEIYDKTSKRYLCLTGNILNGSRTIHPRQEAVDALYKEIFGSPIPEPPPKQNAPQNGSDLFQWDGNIEHLPISSKIRSEILDGREKGQRSETMFSVLCALVWSNLTDSQIYEVFETYPIGEKYREKGGNRENWLRPQIEKARSKTLDRAKPYKQPQQPEPHREAQQEPKEKPAFKFIHISDVLANLKPIEWRIDSIVVENSLIYDFGDSGSYKSFAALDRLLCVAAGIDYHGHRVKQGTVFYIAGEGQQGIGRRLAAWQAALKISIKDLPFFMAEVPTQLTDKAAVEAVKFAVDALAAQHGPPAMIHFDTFNRNLGDGDENATKDVSTVISNLDLTFNNSVNLGFTHHTGHANKDRARGSIVLHNSSDGAFRFSLTADNKVLIECTKQKDAPQIKPLLFKIGVVPLFIGGQPDSSCVMELVAEGEEAASMACTIDTSRISGNMNKTLHVLDEMYAEYEANLQKSGRSGSVPRVEVNHWRDECLKRGLYKRADNFNRARQAMTERGLVYLDDNGRFVYSVLIYRKYCKNCQN